MSKDSNILVKPLIRLRRSPMMLAQWGLFVAAIAVGVWFLLGIGCQLFVETLWFNKLGYLAVFWIRLGTKVGAWVGGTGLSLLFLGWSLLRAHRLQHPNSVHDLMASQPAVSPRGYQRSPLADDTNVRSSGSATLRNPALLGIPPHTSLSFTWLLTVAVAVSLFMNLLIWHYGKVAVRLWQFSAGQPGTVPIIPSRFRFDTFSQLVQDLLTAQEPWFPYFQLGVLLASTIALLIYPRVLLSAIALLLSASFGGIFAANWSQLLLFFRAQPFGRFEPLLGRDIGFYIFSLPIWQLLEFWLVGLFLYTLLAVTLIYLLSGKSLSHGQFPGFSYAQRHHLCQLSGYVMLAVCLSYWLSRYELSYSSDGAVFGAAYTEATVQLPANTLMAVLAGAIALYLFWRAYQNRLSRSRSGFLRGKLRLPLSIPVPLVVLVAFLLLSIVSSVLLPSAVQKFSVQPNELNREEPYLRRAIALTREAFNLEAIQVETFNPTGNLTYTNLLSNDQTIRNIRLWDTRPLLETNRQLQQIRPYYRFFDADIDRYTVEPENRPNNALPLPQLNQPTKQQVLISARELDYQSVPDEAKTWVNEHLVYTHGYGFTLSPVNQVAAGGLPYYYVKDIGTSSTGNLSTSSAAISASIPIGQPRIYYGELTDTYVMTDTRLQELDYPSENDNVYNTYDGQGGIEIGSWWKRLIFSRYLLDWQMALTNYFTPETKLLFRRNINERVRKIAPFLRYDRDPYLVVANTGCLGLDLGCSADLSEQAKRQTPNYLYWILDAYTVSDHYPYSEPSSIQGTEWPAEVGDRFNYIRNSVKVVIDAYNGTTRFYIADTTDPVIQTWVKIFPKLFRPLSELPLTLRSHVRYPADLFSVQAERLRAYHMTDPQVFYNKEDQWAIPTEIYGNQSQPVEPYFLITKLPTVVGDEEFILLLPFKPSQRTNLIAWLAARSDGENYGKALLYVFPKQQLVYGIEQIEARINQDPVISQQISLWNRQGSRVLQGNLLVIPIEQSLLYVEPLYLEAEQNSLPTLVSVVTAYENRITMANTLEKALSAIFQAGETVAPTIVRPVE